MWDIFSLPNPLNQEDKWGIILLQYLFSLESVKRHVKSLQKCSKADQYVVHNIS